MKNKKVFLLQGIIPSYRVPVFRHLSKMAFVDLKVFYSRPNAEMCRDNLINAQDISGFEHEMIPLFELGKYTYQFMILKHVLIYRPDVMITGEAGRFDTLLLAILCKILHIRMLWFQGGVPYKDKEKILEYANRGRLNRWFGKYNPRRYFMFMVDGLIAYSKHAKQYYINIGFPEDKIWIAPNSPDTISLIDYQNEWLQRPDELQDEKKRFAPSGEKIIFLLGRLNKGRKVDVLLRALNDIKEKIPKISILIIGDGSERENIEKLAVNLGLHNVFFEGAVYDEKELSKYFMISDIFVTPGVASLAIKMAMFFGKPVVTVDYGLEVHDIEEGYNGFTFPMNNHKALADKLYQLFSSDKLIERIGKNGIDTMREKINIENMMQGFNKAIFNEKDLL